VLCVPRTLWNRDGCSILANLRVKSVARTLDGAGWGHHRACGDRSSAGGSAAIKRETGANAHGFTVEMLVDLVRAGLATAKTDRIVAGGRPMEVARVRITDADRRSLAERAK
jgi:hypothetical protein